MYRKLAVERSSWRIQHRLVVGGRALATPEGLPSRTAHSKEHLCKMGGRGREKKEKEERKKCKMRCGMLLYLVASNPRRNRQSTLARRCYHLDQYRRRCYQMWCIFVLAPNDHHDDSWLTHGLKVRRPRLRFTYSP